jgi:hypothetical protein
VCDCEDETEGAAAYPGIPAEALTACTREIEADLPGERVPEEAWPVFLGEASGSLIWDHHERMARSREAALVMLSLRSGRG